MYVPEDRGRIHNALIESDVTPSIQAHWALITAVTEVLIEADRVDKALKKAPSKIVSLIRAYAEGDAPWCLLDTYHRRMESRWYAFEPELGADHQSLEHLIIEAEQRYTDIGTELAKHFVTQFHKTKHPIICTDLSSSGLLTVAFKPFLTRDLEERFEPESRASGSLITLGMSSFGVFPQIGDHGLKGTAIPGPITVTQSPEEFR